MKNIKFNLMLAGLLIAITGSVNAGQWDGIYGGVLLGARHMDAEWTTTDYRDPNNNVLPFASDRHATLSDDSDLWGAYAGYNLMLTDSLLFGVELTFRHGDNEDTQTGLPGAFESFDPAPFPYSTLTVKTDQDASIRARFGYIMASKFQLYTALGLAYEELELSAECPRDTNICNPAFPTRQESRSANELGWTIGLGAEMLFTNNLVGRVEYSYADYGSVDFTAVQSVSGQAFGVSGEVNTATESLTAGIAYKF